MRMRALLGAAAAAVMTAACAGSISDPVDPGAFAVVEEMTGYTISDAAKATAALNDDGDVRGALAYETPADAVKAGDMGAFVALVKLDQLMGDAPPGFSSMILAMDRTADGDIAGARAVLEEAREQSPQSDLPDYLDSWMLALSGDGDAAVETHRQFSGSLPGLTADLSLAAMLEGLGRDEEALAVYASLTPGDITAPEHDFDPQGLVFGHVQTVIARRTLLLRRLDRVDEATEVYTRLAEAEPEQAARYSAAIQSLVDGEGLDDEALSARGAFARTIADLSLSLYQQRIIRAAMVGQRVDGFDHQRSALNQMALLIEPDNEDLRDLVIDGLFREALFAGAAHVADSAPAPTAGLQLAAAQSFLRAGDPDSARRAVRLAEEVAEPDDELSVSAGAASIYMFLGDEERSLALSERAIAATDNDAERAFALAAKAQVLSQLGRYEEAVEPASAARDLDDTHDRRMYLANALGKAGDVDTALRMLRSERLARPNDPYMLNTLGYFLITETDRYEEGFKILSRAVALQDTDPYIADSFGWARFKLGDFEGALRYIELARDELAPHTHWEIDDHLGDVYWALGREDEAREAWELSLTTYPPADVRASIERKLEEGLSSLPEKRPLPDVSLDDAGEVDRQDI